MKICDKCRRKGETKPAPVPVTIGIENFDLCLSCSEIIKALINEDPKENIDNHEDYAINGNSEPAGTGKKRGRSAKN